MKVDDDSLEFVPVAIDKMVVITPNTPAFRQLVGTKKCGSSYFDEVSPDSAG